MTLSEQRGDLFLPLTNNADVSEISHVEIWIEFMPGHLYCFFSSPEKANLMLFCYISGQWSERSQFVAK